MAHSRIRAVRIVIAALLLLGVTGQVWAQGAAPRDPRAARPFRGLFGGDNPPDENGQLLDVTVSLSGGYDDDISGRSGGTSGQLNSAVRLSSAYGGGAATLRYRRQMLERFTIDGSIGGSSSVYTDVDNLIATRGNAGLGLVWQASRRTRLLFTTGLAYSPFYSYAPFPAAGYEEPLAAPDVSPDVRVQQSDNLASSTAASVTQAITSRLSFSAGGHYGRTEFLDRTDKTSAENYGGRAGFSYSLTRHLRARLGYSYRTRRYAGDTGNEFSVNGIDAGLDYSRALAFSFSPRTQLTFSSGTAIASSGDRRRLYVVGNANVTHRMGRTWAARLTYARSVQVVDGFDDVFLSDALSATLGGYVGSRVSMVGGAAMNWGQLGLANDGALNRATRAAYVTQQVSVALTELLALRCSYFYYRYAFDPGAAALPEGLDPRNSRHGVRVSLVFWIPLVR